MPLADLLPPVHIAPAWFTVIALAAPAIAAGQSAWYGLQRVQIHADTSAEMQALGIEAELLPTDVDGTGGASAQAWGTSAGLGAALVVGRDLPIQLGAWTSAAAMLPGVETASNLTTQGRQSPYLWWSTFPTGKFTDATPNKFHIVKSWAPGAHPFPKGASLDVALVVRRAQANGITGNYYGFASVQLSAVMTKRNETFNP